MAFCNAEAGSGGAVGVAWAGAAVWLAGIAALEVTALCAAPLDAKAGRGDGVRGAMLKRLPWPGVPEMNAATVR